MLDERDRAMFQWPTYDEATINEVCEFIRRGEVSYSTEPRRLEEEFQSLVPCKYALAMSSGTSAIYSGFYALGISSGDEVVCPAYAYCASIMPAVTLGARIVFCDVSKETSNIDILRMEKCITPRTRAIVVIHTSGLPCEIGPICELARDPGIGILEDCSHAHGAKYRGVPVGSFGDIPCFSLKGTKLIPGGEGGILLTNKKGLYERAVALGHHRLIGLLGPQWEMFKHTPLGFNFRMSPLHAHLARAGLANLDRQNSIRSFTCGEIRSLLKKFPDFEVYDEPSYIQRVFYENPVLFCGEPSRRIAWLEAFNLEGLPVREYGMVPLHRQEVFRKGGASDSCPNADYVNKNTLYFPVQTVENEDVLKKYKQSIVRVGEYVDSKGA